MFFKRFLIFALCLHCSFCQSRQLKADTIPVYDVSQLRQDYMFFRLLLEKAHPSLYRYTPKDSIDKYFDIGYHGIDHPMNDLQFWELLQGMTARINSGHTYIAFNPRLSKVYNYSGHSILPFYIYIRENRIFIKDYMNGIDTAYKIGNQVLQVNGVNASQLLNQFRALISGDGYGTAYKDYKLEKFDFFLLYNMLYGDQVAFSIVFKTQRGIETKKIRALKAVMTTSKLANGTPAKLIKQYNKSNESWQYEDSPTVVFPPTIDSTAVLRISSFYYKDYQTINKSLFNEIIKRNSRNLILDLRGNPGGDGNTCVDLLKYLIKDSYYFLGFKEYAVDTTSFILIVNNIDKLAQHNISSIVHEPTLLHNMAVHHSNNKTFNGNIYILTDGGTFSAASLFATALKKQVQCLVIGQETGGGELGTDGLKIVDIKLTNTGLLLRLPLYWTYSASTKQNIGRGLMPDVKLKLGAKQIYEQRYLGIDAALELVKQRIKQNNRQ